LRVLKVKRGGTTNERTQEQGQTKNLFEEVRKKGDVTVGIFLGTTNVIFYGGWGDEGKSGGVGREGEKRETKKARGISFSGNLGEGNIPKVVCRENCEATAANKDMRRKRRPRGVLLFNRGYSKVISAIKVNRRKGGRGGVSR